MKELFITYSGAIQFDPETQKASAVHINPDSVRRVFKVSEPTHVTYEIGETKQELYAEEGDLVVEFSEYRSEYPNMIVVAKSAQWLENINAYEDEEQKRKEKWAAEKLTTAEDALRPMVKGSSDDACKAASNG